MIAGRVRLLSIVVSCFALCVMARTSGAQDEEPRKWAVGLYGGPGIAGGEAASVMHLPFTAVGSVQRRISSSHWWVGIDLNYVVAQATRAGLDTLVAHAGYPYQQAPGNSGSYTMGGFAVAVRRVQQTSGPLEGFFVATYGYAITDGRLCSHALGCTPSDGNTGEIMTTRAASSIGGGVAIRAGDLWGALASIPVKLSAEARVASTRTQHGTMLTVPLLLGVTY